MRRLALAAVFALALVAPPATARTPHRYPPIDECTKLPGAAAFRASLAKAARRRDARALVALADKNIELDFGGGAGTAELRKRLAGSQGRELWRALDRMLPLGCAYRNTNLILPSLFSVEFTDVDAMSVFLVTGAAVPLRDRPEGRSRIVATLSWDLVEPVAGTAARGGFSKVRVIDRGRTGYVETARLRSPIDYRLLARRRSGVWRIEALIAGD